uniref:Uncharacterized protein n=1 Tax=Arundo donax TaxID=35708 RepID=A0A0A8ZVY3_ARUDO
MPHGSSDGRLPADKSSVTSVLDGEEQHCLHTDITLEQLEEIMLPKAVDHFRLNAEATAYRMLWKSKHGTAYIQVEKASTKMQSTRRMIWGAKKGKILQRQDQVLESRPYVIPRFLNLWVAHAPVQLRGSIVDWIQKEEENWLAPPPLRLKF